MNWREQAEELEASWRSERWSGVERHYSAEEVVRLRGSIKIEYTIAKLCAEKFWRMLKTLPYVSAMGALTGNQAVQMVEAGLRSIYVSGWQVAADNNASGNTYPDLGLYPLNSVPLLVNRIVRALQRRDQIMHLQGRNDVDYFVPVVADGEAGFGGVLHAFELMKAMIEAGAAGVHLEDQSPGERRCGHLAGKVLVPTERFIRILIAARLAADVMGVPTILIARTDALDAKYITSDVDERDSRFITGGRTPEGYFTVSGGLEMAMARALAVAPYCDMIWFETSRPDLEEAREFADRVHSRYPNKMLAYNLSPSFNWSRHVDPETLRDFQRRLGSMGYRFQFITLAGFHALCASTFELSKGMVEEGMPAYVRLQQKEFELEGLGYKAVKHQSLVGVNYYDEVTKTIYKGRATTTAFAGSTEEAQF